MRLAFLLHLYQPIIQDRDVFQNVYHSCYSPLLKLIKNKKDFSLTLNVPLSLLEQMDKYGHQDWISTLKELVASERVELTGSAAYHALLTKLPASIAEEQIILNEYGLGYYLGRRTGFEGQPSILVQNLNGFFSPELAVNKDLINLVSEMGYTWAIADECAVSKGKGIYSIKDLPFNLVVRNNELSNILSFKRDSVIEDIASLFFDKGDSVIALDGETFGHHNKEGIVLLDTLFTAITDRGVKLMRVSDYLDVVDPVATISFEDIKESTWGCSLEEFEKGDIYPMWSIKGNSLQKKLWELNKKVCASINTDMTTLDMPDHETTPIWKEYPSKEIEQKIAFHRSLGSDQFWWSSGKVMPDGRKLYDKNMIMKSLNVSKNYAVMVGNTDLQSAVESVLNTVHEM